MTKDVQDLLARFTDSAGASSLLRRSRATVSDMADRGVITRYRVGAALLYDLEEIREVAAALRRLELGAGGE